MGWPTVDGIPFSEDSTEDFTEWVVGEGPEVWRKAVEADDLSELGRRYWKEGATSWDLSIENNAYRGHQSCRGVATVAFEVIHGGDLSAALEELHSRGD